MTANIVNLNKFRKARDKSEDKKRAEENRVRFGRTKSEIQKEKFEAGARAKLLDAARRDDGAEPGHDGGGTKPDTQS